MVYYPAMFLMMIGKCSLIVCGYQTFSLFSITVSSYMPMIYTCRRRPISRQRYVHVLPSVPQLCSTKVYKQTLRITSLYSQILVQIQLPSALHPDKSL